MMEVLYYTNLGGTTISSSHCLGWVFYFIQGGKYVKGNNKGNNNI